MSPPIHFRSSVDAYLVHLAAGDLGAAAREFHASAIRVFENDVLVARDAETYFRKLQPILRRAVMMRGTIDRLCRDRPGETAAVLCRFDGVDTDGKLVRDEVLYQQRWSGGQVVEERQYRGAALAPAISAALEAGMLAPEPGTVRLMQSGGTAACLAGTNQARICA
ncbi:hypothetical protein H1W37_03470 [Stappia taiwanensis]|uniref:SnoaL-like domain-containing protein n=1 Tax=Stappia taiwanensis TaxID=992267 RepID=A0A838XH28_9HYPH|nr:hypothetical protein [Stappia taiwanensis]MBA4610699.1 hypothetical protein [Stappia taiwanensis]GGE82817.1 hypothetical protein GCM10007285_08000 [Stappia taiwanensis]